MSCVAVTCTGKSCRSKGKHVFAKYRSCGIASHMVQVQRMASLVVPNGQGSPAPPEHPLNPGVSPLVPAVIIVENGIVRKRSTMKRNEKPTYIHGARGNYRIIRKIGHGAYGTVYEVELDGIRYAINQQQSTDAGTAMSRSALVEADVMSRLEHPNLVRMLEVFFEGGRSTSINYVMEREELTLRGMTSIQSPNIIKALAFQLICAVNFLHTHCVIHADIKPENILLSNSQQGYRLKLADFGLSQYNMGQAKSLEVQTFWYRAPEIWKRDRNYTTAIDMWSIGLILRELLVCRPLSSSRSEKTYFQTIQSLLGSVPEVGKDLTGTKKDWDPVEWGEYIRLINGCLVYDPTMRLTAVDLLNSSLFSRCELPTGSSYLENVTPPQHKDIHKLLRDWTVPHSSYHASTLALAVNLFDRAKEAGDISSSEEKEIALGALNIALKINQRIPLPSNSFSTMIGRSKFTVGEMWNLEARVAQLLGFRFYIGK